MNAPIQLPDTFEGTQSSHRVSDLKVAIKDSISSVFEVEDFMVRFYDFAGTYWTADAADVLYATRNL